VRCVAPSRTGLLLGLGTREGSPHDIREIAHKTLTAARCAAARPVAADPVSRRRPAGAVGPTNSASAGEKGLLCQRPGRWLSGARAARNRAATSRGPRLPALAPSPALAPAPSPARPRRPGPARSLAPRSWTRLLGVAWAGGVGVFAGICGERGRRGLHDVCAEAWRLRTTR
jgi:hypothetical protein